MKMFCITLDNNHYQKIKDFGYYPVGLGPKIKNENFLRDNTGHNITKKNPGRKYTSSLVKILKKHKNKDK